MTMAKADSEDEKPQADQETTIIGDVSEQNHEEVLELLGPKEKLKLIAAVPVKRGQGHNFLILTNTRVLFQTRVESGLLGEKKGVEDVPYSRISRIDSETRKDYDLLKIRTKGGKQEELMAPKEESGRIVGLIRSLELEERKEKSESEQTDREAERESSLEKVEKLQELKEEGAISDEEFEQKKQELLEEV